MSIVFYGTAALAMICLVVTFIPLIPRPWGIVRVFDFPRVQIAYLSGASLLVLLTLFSWTPSTLLFAAMAAVSLLLQAWKIARFSPLWPKRSHSYTGEPADAPVFTLMASNVKQGNRDYSQLKDLVREIDPDIAVFMETDEDWITELKDITSDYEWSMERPYDNAYGMYLVSRHKLVDPEIKELLKERVPSFHMDVELGDGNTFRLITVHPEPPVPHAVTSGRDGEISLVGDIARDHGGAMIVAGDLNDVAWSRTTRRFLRISRLLDPREGRGQFNSFHAGHFWARWPLDHIFHTPHFKLVTIERLPNIGSDHFPMLFKLARTETDDPKRDTDEATSNDIAEADDRIERAEKGDKTPIGEDWED